MNGRTLPNFILATVTCLVIVLTECAVSAQVRPHQTTSASKASARTPPSLKKYFPQRVGKLILTEANLSTEESKSMKRSWVSLFGATEFSRGIYSDPESQELSQAIAAAVLLTVASFPSSKKADSAVASLTTVLMGRGYAIERKRLGERSGRSAEMTIAASQNADDWAVIWSRGSVVFQVQSSTKKENALGFARSFPY